MEDLSQQTIVTVGNPSDANGGNQESNSLSASTQMLKVFLKHIFCISSFRVYLFVFKNYPYLIKLNC